MRRRRAARFGTSEDGPFTRTVLGIGRNLLAGTKLGSLSQKNLRNLEGVALVEEPSSLSWADFEHLQPAADLARDLVRGAAAKRHRGLNILLYGPTGTGKSELARRLAREAGLRAYSAGAADDEGGSPAPDERLSSLLLGQRLLARDRAMLIFDEMEDLFSWRWEGMHGRRGKAYMSKQWFNALLESCCVPTIWISNTTSGVDPAFLRRFTYALELGPLDARQRARVLRRHLCDAGGASDDEVEELARRYPVSPAQLATAVKAAAINTDGDSDSIGAIAGSVVGTRLGIEAIPGTWVERVEQSIAIQSVGRRLWDKHRERDVKSTSYK